MGMYTEMILGCRLSKNTPKICIDSLNYIINSSEEESIPSKEIQDFVEKYSLGRLFWCSSYYFGVCSAHCYFKYDDIVNSWILSTRSNIKNYDSEIEKFLEYLEPYVETGSGEHEIYAYVLYETCDFPTMYSKDGIYKVKTVSK